MLLGALLLAGVVGLWWLRPVPLLPWRPADYVAWTLFAVTFQLLVVATAALQARELPDPIVREPDRSHPSSEPDPAWQQDPEQDAEQDRNRTGTGLGNRARTGHEQALQPRIDIVSFRAVSASLRGVGLEDENGIGAKGHVPMRAPGCQPSGFSRSPTARAWPRTTRSFMPTPTAASRGWPRFEA